MDSRFSTEPLERRAYLTDIAPGGGGFVHPIDNAYLPLIAGSTYIYRGADDMGRAVRSRVTVTDRTEVIGGVTTTLVRERRYVDGAIVGDAREHYAQDEAGNVWRFDPAGRRIVMPAAASAANVLAVDEHARVPFGTFADCVKSDGPGGTDLYAPGIGRVSSRSNERGGTVLRLAYVNLSPQAFDEKVDNPYFPLTPGTTLIYRGHDNGTPVRQRVTISGQTQLIAGVETTVMRVREYADGELFEDTREYFAQDKAGNVWYFGEDSRQYEDGELVAADGSWLAGVGGAQPGILMRARPAVGDTYQMEFYPGVAEDQAEVLATRQTVKVPYGTLGDVIHVLDFSLLEPDDVENKYYAPGLGFVMEEAGDGEDGENMKLAYVLIEDTPQQ